MSKIHSETHSSSNDSELFGPAAVVSIPVVKPVRPLSEFRPPDQLPVDTRKRSSEGLDPSAKRPRSDERPADSPVDVPTPPSAVNVNPYLSPNRNLPSAPAHRIAHAIKRVQIQGNGWISFSPSVNQPIPPAGPQTGDTITISSVNGEAGSVTQRAVLPIGSEFNKGFRAKNVSNIMSKP